MIRKLICDSDSEFLKGQKCKRTTKAQLVGSFLLRGQHKFSGLTKQSVEEWLLSQITFSA